MSENRQKKPPDWGRVADLAAELLELMEKSKRCSVAERLVVASAEATLRDGQASAELKSRAARAVGDMFGVFHFTYLAANRKTVEKQEIEKGQMEPAVDERDSLKGKATISLLERLKAEPESPAAPAIEQPAS